MTSSSIKDYEEVLNLLIKRAKDLETFTTYCPRNRFIEAFVGDRSLSFAVQDEDGSIFAMALGQDPVILKCDRLATSRGLDVDTKLFERRTDWDFYSIATDAFAALESAETGSDSEEISAFLNTHAPDSSVWPDDKEILFWGEKRIAGDLVALGAMVQWRTGQVMFASIGTHTDHRNKGLARELVSHMLARVAKLGVTHVGLGVFAENGSAKRAYENVGFELVNEFSSFQRLKD